MGDIERIHRIDHSPAIPRIDQRDYVKKRRDDEQSRGNDSREDQDQVELTLLEEADVDSAPDSPQVSRSDSGSPGHIDFSA
ncbi:hypothetical protein QPK87_01550 [Kamptonema cortianum]|nr:hypothetical protein [Geitlerinema splendidum]MDK3155273.1 hypothetical protein [Kamptonema cortianum]